MIKLLFMMTTYANLTYNCEYNNKNIQLSGNSHFVSRNLIYTFNVQQEWATISDGKNTVTYHLSCSLPVIIDQGTQKEN